MTRREVLGWIGLGVFGAALLMWLPQNYEKTQVVSTSSMAKEIYARVLDTRISKNSAELYTETIQQRQLCYQEHSNIRARINICNARYLDSIVANTRSQMISSPDIGNFIDTVKLCPIVHSICMTELGTEEACLQYETRCIDYSLDMYWRGSATTKQMFSNVPKEKY